MMPGPCDRTMTLRKVKPAATMQHAGTDGQRRGETTMKMLLAVDGSGPSLHAVRHALALAAQGLDAQFVVVNVQEPASLYEMVVAHDPAVIEQVRGAAGADLIEAAERLLEEAGVDYESEVAGGTPATLIVELAENYGCQAIVCGARGAGDPEGSGLGSVAQALVDHCPMPVTVVRAQAQPAGAEGDDPGEGPDAG
jgi:nucleotide-binding universal stress UspA family protein